MKVKILNIVIVLAIVLGLLPQNVFAIEEKSKTYIYDNFTVGYNIVDSWGDTQNISISVTNTGIEPIENWMFTYDFKGETYDIWNAEIKENSDGVKYIRNLGYNNVIEPGSMISFGYALANASGFPDDFTMCQKRTARENGFDVSLTVLDSWDDSFNGEITIQNNTTTAIECWELSFDSNFTIVEITDSWAANILNYDNGKYTLKGTYTNIIYANSSISLGFIAIKNGEPEIRNYSLTEVAAEINDSYIHVDDMYYKPIQSSDDIDYDGEGIYFVRNQILVTAYQDVSFDEVKELADRYNVKIVGYIDLTNDYQLEFQSDVSAELLYQQIEEISSDPLVEYASLNTVLSLEENGIEPKESDLTEFEESIDENDTYTEQEKNEKKEMLKYANWHIGTINADDAWDNYYDLMSDVKIGLIDGAFYKVHIDLNENFNKGEVWDKPNNKSDDEDIFHGTHVAGIMAAEFNNGIGISGICPKNSLYAYSIRYKVMDTSIMEYKAAFAALIANNVRVINISLGTGELVCVGASRGNENALKDINASSEILGKFMQKIINLGYDFVIVSSAGNTNNKKYKEDSSEDYGYKFDENNGNMTGARAEYNSYWNYIGYNDPEFKDVRDRIIVVGSIGIDEKLSGYYHNSNFSNYGDRVDIVAPGENILSTVNNYNNSDICLYKDRYKLDSYAFDGGTSMAAPQVSGVAGMIYSLRPDLTASEVKEIIIEAAKKSYENDYGRRVSYIEHDDEGRKVHEYTYNILDAEIALDIAMGKDFGDEPDNKDEAIIYGTVYSYNKPANNAQIYVTSQTTAEEKKFETDENGDYLFTLPPDIYDIDYVAVVDGNSKVTTWSFNGYIGFINNDICYYNGNNIKIEAGEVYPLNVRLDGAVGIISLLEANENEDSESKAAHDVNIEIKDKNKKKTYAETISSYLYYSNLKDGEYTICASKTGYVPQEINVKAIDGTLYDEDGNKFTYIKLIPIYESTITGAVMIYNKNTYDVFPKANHTVTILQNDSPIGTAVTNSKGIYEIKIEAAGDIVVEFDPDKKESIYVDGGKYTANACYYIKKVNDDDDDDDDEDYKNKKDAAGRPLGLPGIIYEYDAPREDAYQMMYYCFSIAIFGPYPDGNYYIYALFNKTVEKNMRGWNEDRITYYEPYYSIAFWSPNTDAYAEYYNGGYRYLVGGSIYPYSKDYLSLQLLPDEVTEKLMEGYTMIFYVDENELNEPVFQYPADEQEYILN